MIQACLAEIAYHLPEKAVTNEWLAQTYPGWSVEKIEAKTGIRQRRIAAEGETSSDLAVKAAQKLFAAGRCAPADFDFLLFCTQTPDYFLPTTACLIQDRLGLPTTAGALDFNLGCSGYIYGLSLAKGLIESGQAKRVLLLTGETYSKLLHEEDKGVRTVFGDAAAATVVEARAGDSPLVGPFVFGTDGRGAENLIVKAGAFRQPTPSLAPESKDQFLFMNGPAIFNFTLESVGLAVERLLGNSSKTIGDVDLFVFHQANRYMLEHLRKKMKIPEEKFLLHLADCGNTVSSTIPIALFEAAQSGRLKPGTRCMLVGFGVGYSWGANFLTWNPGA